jgi:hypothetical protein
LPTSCGADCRRATCARTERAHRLEQLRRLWRPISRSSTWIACATSAR